MWDPYFSFLQEVSVTHEGMETDRGRLGEGGEVGGVSLSDIQVVTFTTFPSVKVQCVIYID